MKSKVLTALGAAATKLISSSSSSSIITTTSSHSSSSQLGFTRFAALRSLASSSSSSSGGRTAEPDVHARAEDGDVYPEERPKGTPTKQEPPIPENDPLVPPKQPHTPSPKLESNAVNPPVNPINQQIRRRNLSSSAPAAAAAADQANAASSSSSSSSSSSWLEDVSCVGGDGTPWPPEDEMDRRTQIKERVEDDKEYFEHHKASPLSEMEMADTRKPITQATDTAAGGGGGGYYGGGGGGGGVLVWRPEQLDTAEEALLRAKRMFEESARRGDPHSPHGSLLRALRNEYW